MMLWILLAVGCTKELGATKSEALRRLSQEASGGIIRLGPAELKQYVLTFPRPYDLVIYFAHKNSKLSKEMEGEFGYLAHLYQQAGTLQPEVVEGKVRNAVYFLHLEYGPDTRFLFDLFEFKSAPNLVVSKPKMAILQEEETRRYLKSFYWEISYNDGHVTAHKMLEFVNKRTEREVLYRPPFTAMLQSVALFLALCLAGYYAVTELAAFWMNPRVWLLCSLLIYVTCCSGVIFNILHGVPMVGRSGRGDVEIFSGGQREQYALEGFLVALMSLLIGMSFVLVKRVHKLTHSRTQERVLFGVLLLSMVLMIRFIEEGYRSKSNYTTPLLPP